MENIGLKSYSKNLEVGLPIGTAYVNLCPQQSNVILEIPIIESMGISFIFNHLAKNERGSMGKGGHISLFKKLKHNRIYNPDFTTDYYDLNEENFETGLTLTKVELPKIGEDPTYELKDRGGNVIKYANPHFNFPTAFIDSKGKILKEYSFEDNSITITSEGDIVELEFNAYGFVERVKHTNLGVLASTVEFGYQNELLTSITFISPRGGSTIYQITHENNILSVKDPLLNKSMEFYFNNEDNRLFNVFLVRGNNTRKELTLLFDDTSSTTTVIDSNNRKEYYFFERRVVREYYFNSMYLNDDGDVSTTEHNDSFNVSYDAGYNRETVSDTVCQDYDLDEFCCECRNYVENDFERTFIRSTAKILESEDAYASFDVDAIGGDSFTLMCFVKAVDKQVEVSATLNEEKTTIKVSNNWKILCAKIDVTQSFQTLDVLLEATGEVIIAGISIFRKSLANFYKYDSNGDCVGDEGYSITKQNGMVSNIIDGNGIRYGFEYDDDGNLIHFRTLNNVEVLNTYSNNRITKQEVKAKDLALTYYKEYDENGRLAFERDDNPYASTFYRYDDFGCLWQIEKATRFVSERYFNIYGDLEKIISRAYNCGQTPNAEVQYKYFDNNHKLIENILVNNGTKYTFEYDDLNRLKKIMLNDICVFRYDYNSRDQIWKQHFGEESDYFEFEYNDRGDVKKVIHSSRSLSYDFIYDDANRLSKVTQTRNGVTKTLEECHYDGQNKIAKVTNDVKSIDKLFDNNGKETRIKNKFYGTEIIHEYDPIERAMGSNPEMIVDELQQDNGYAVASFVGGNACVGKDKTYPCHYRKNKNNSSYLESDSGQWQLYSNEAEQEGSISYIDSSKRIAFVAKGEGGNPLKQTVAFWFKSSSHTPDGCLFYTKSRKNKCSLALYEREYRNNHWLEVVATDTNGSSGLLLDTSSKEINPEMIHFDLDEWTFIALTCFVEYKNGGKRYITCRLQINSTVFETTLSDVSFPWYIEDKYLEMNFGYVYIPQVQSGEEQITNPYDRCKFTLIAIGDRQTVISNEVLNEYFRRTKDYLTDNAMGETDEVFDCSITRLIKDDKTRYGSFKVFPLENNLFPLDYDPSSQNDYDKPSAFDIRKGYKNDRDVVFNFDSILKKYVFVADGKKLSYKANIGNSGTIAARFFFENTNEKQYLFDVWSSESKLGLYKQGSSGQIYLAVDSNGNTNSEPITCIGNNAWHDVALSFDKRIESGYFGSSQALYIRVIVNGSVAKEVVIPNASLSNEIEIMLGRSFSENQSNSQAVGGASCYALMGRISSFAYNNAYNNPETIIELFGNKARTVTKTTWYNAIGVPTKEEIIKNNTTILRKEVDYTGHIFGETITAGSNYEVARGYSYDNRLGHVTYISCSDGETFCYEYDFQGFLVSEEINGGSYYMHYSYDSNGNMLSRSNNYINDVFEYDGDRLIKLNGNAVNYAPNNKGIITGFENWQFAYEGRRLRRAIATGGSRRLEVVFDYNERGQRISKTVIASRVFYNPRTGTSVTTELSRKTFAYEYDGTNLVYERSDDNELFYLYDENKQMYGYILNGNKYFFIKDMLNNILGLVDENGNVAAKYVYDAFGNLVSSTGNVYNPIRYKGYYFDTETELFYCINRYYSPRLCRWLSMDNPAYLMETDTSRLNLFNYCSNNPVMLYDPDGHFIISALIVGAIAGAIIGTTISIVSQGIDKGWDKINGWQVLLDGTIGAVGGLAAASGIGAFGCALISGGLGFIGSVGGDLIENNGDWEKVNWQKATLMGALNFGLGFLCGSGSQTADSFAKTMLQNSEVKRTFGIILDSSIKYEAKELSKKGFQGVMNLYGKQFVGAVAKAYPSYIAKVYTETAKNLGKLAIAGAISSFASWALSLMY